MPDPKRKQIGDLPVLSEFGSDSSPYLVANDHDNQETGLVDGYGFVSEYLSTGLDTATEYPNLNTYLSEHVSSGEEVTLSAVESAMSDAYRWDGHDTARYDILGYWLNDDNDRGSLARMPASDTVANALGQLRYQSSDFPEGCELLIKLPNNDDSFIRADASEFLSEYGAGGGEITLAAINDALDGEIPEETELSEYNVLIYSSESGLAEGLSVLGTIDYAIGNAPSTYDLGSYGIDGLLAYAELGDSNCIVKLPIDAIPELATSEYGQNYALLTYGPYYTLEGGERWGLTQLSELSYLASDISSYILTQSGIEDALAGVYTENVSYAVINYDVLMFDGADFIRGTDLSGYLSDYISEYLDEHPQGDSHTFDYHMCSYIMSASDCGYSYLSDDTRLAILGYGNNDESHKIIYITLSDFMSYISNYFSS